MCRKHVWSQAQVITSHRYLWNVIICPCSWCLLLEHKSSNGRLCFYIKRINHRRTPRYSDPELFFWQSINIWSCYLTVWIVSDITRNIGLWYHDCLVYYVIFYCQYRCTMCGSVMQTKSHLRKLLYMQDTHMLITIASQITDISIIYSTVCSGADQGKIQSSASLAFVRGIHRWPVISPQKGSVTRKMFPFEGVIMKVNFATILDSIYAETTVKFQSDWTVWNSDTVSFIFRAICGPFY